MRVACLYDIHGNLAALEAVLADAEREGFDLLLLGGDYVVNGPRPAECLDRLRAYGGDVRWLQGNTDRWVVEGKDDAGVRWTAEALGDERIAWLAGLPTRLELPGGAGIAVHATPRSDEELVVPETPAADLRAMLGGAPPGLVVSGHSHVQYERTLDGWTLLNPGSVGFPSDGQTTAAWAVLDGDVRHLRRTAYPVEETIEQLGAVGHPARERSVTRLRTAERP